MDTKIQKQKTPNSEKPNHNRSHLSCNQSDFLKLFAPSDGRVLRSL